MTHAVIQLYPPKVEDGPFASVKTDQAEYLRLATEFGLQQLSSGNTVVRTECQDWCRTHELEPLTEEELAVWREYLPTSYWSNSAKARRNFDDERILGFADYSFHEGVPLPVLRRMKQVAPMFDVLEIRTPEVPQRMVADPVLWGHTIFPNGNRQIYPLGRWAESDANFVSGIEDVKKILRARRGVIFGDDHTRQNPLVQLFSFAVAGGVAFAIVAWVLAYLSSYVPYGWPAFFTGMAVGAALLIVDLVSHYRRMSALQRENPQLARLI